MEPSTCTGRPGTSAAIDICFRRALSTPCTCATCVLSVSSTTSLEESDVCNVIVGSASSSYQTLDFDSLSGSDTAKGRQRYG